MDYIRVYCGNELRKQYELGEERVTIGRTEDNTVVLAESGVSRLHAAIEYEDGDYFIVDQGSRNGVFLNNERIEKHKLKYWDEIQIHNFVIKFMAKPGFGVTKEDEAASDIEADKTKFFNLNNEEELEKLRKKTKQCFVSFIGDDGTIQKLVLKKPRTIIGSAKEADIKLSGLLAPSIAATIERQGSTYELVPGKRGKVIFKTQRILGRAKLTDDSTFVVRDMEFKFFNRLTKTN